MSDHDKPLPLNEDRDALRWAREFNRVLTDQGRPPLEEDWLFGWFANAMMCGEDTYRWRQEKSASSAMVPCGPGTPLPDFDSLAVTETVPTPDGHDDATARIEKCVREIEIICDHFGYDASEWLADKEARAEEVAMLPRALIERKISDLDRDQFMEWLDSLPYGPSAP